MAVDALGDGEQRHAGGGEPDPDEVESAAPPQCGDCERTGHLERADHPQRRAIECQVEEDGERRERQAVGHDRAPLLCGVGAQPRTEVQRQQSGADQPRTHTTPSGRASSKAEIAIAVPSCRLTIEPTTSATARVSAVTLFSDGVAVALNGLLAGPPADTSPPRHETQGSDADAISRARLGRGTQAAPSPVRQQLQPATIVAASAIRWSFVQGGPIVARGPCRTSSARSPSMPTA
jgi:hypothetical protein